MIGKRIAAGDASEDGHPCEVALAFRTAVKFADVADEVPADILDLAIQFAWIGKAVSRTGHLGDWLRDGIDPNTREIVAAMAVDSRARQMAVLHAGKGAAAPRLEANLRAIRTSQAFVHAIRVAGGLCGSSPAVADVIRLSRLAEFAAALPDTKRPAPKPPQASVLSLEAFRKQRSLA